ncbi:MAG: hypothetical protein MK165_21700, partial [Pirellulaceae bacterium]|nr:hypothetical protein [Pirellulaceae bacterium]
ETNTSRGIKDSPTHPFTDILGRTRSIYSAWIFSRAREKPCLPSAANIVTMLVSTHNHSLGFTIITGPPRSERDLSRVRCFTRARNR